MKSDRDFLADCLGGSLLYAWLLFTYFIPNRFSFFPGREVPRLSLDLKIPADAQWVWIYLFCYLFVIGAWMVSGDGKGRETFAKALTLSGLFSGLIFIFYPTTLPREIYPFVGEGVAEQVIRFFRQIDLSRNCAPSMHVATSFISVYAYGVRGPVWALFATILAGLIAISTLATKQHYAWDVGTGFLLALVCLGIARIQLDIKNNDRKAQGTEDEAHR